MAKRMPDNLRTKRKYLLWLRQAKGFSEATVDKAAASVDRYLAHLRGSGLRQFHSEKALGFKRHLDKQRHPRTGAALARSTVNGTLQDTKAFSKRPAGQNCYLSRIRYTESA